LPQDEERKISIRLENADIWTSMWITYYFYKLVDKKEIDKIEIRKVVKSRDSIELEIILFIIGIPGTYVAHKGLDRLTPKIVDMLGRWKEKKRQTNLKMFMDNEQL